MKKYKQQLKSSLIEMANISVKRSGIEEGWIQIRNEKRHSNFPHVHYVHNLKKSNHEFIKLTINEKIEDIQIIENKMKLLVKELNKVKLFISKNYKVLIDYYLQGDVIDTDDFMDSLKKIN